MRHLCCHWKIDLLKAFVGLELCLHVCDLATRILYPVALGTCSLQCSDRQATAGVPPVINGDTSRLQKCITTDKHISLHQTNTQISPKKSYHDTHTCTSQLHVHVHALHVVSYVAHFPVCPKHTYTGSERGKTLTNTSHNDVSIIFNPVCCTNCALNNTSSLPRKPQCKLQMDYNQLPPLHAHVMPY